jgi:predicted phosphoribosyltransferase
MKRTMYSYLKNREDAAFINSFSEAVDELICLYTPDPFVGVGLHYQHFEPVSDEEVRRLLKKANQVRGCIA